MGGWPGSRGMGIQHHRFNVKSQRLHPVPIHGPLSFILGQLCGQLKSCNSTFNTANQIMCRSRHFARENIRSGIAQVMFPNFYVDNATFLETGPGAAATLTGAIEYPIGTTCAQIRWSNLAACTAPNGGMTPLSDPVVLAGTIPAGAPFMVRAFYECAAGFVADNRANVVDNGQGYRFAVSGLADQTMVPGAPAGGTGSANFMYKPVVLAGPTTVPSVTILGDSRQEGNDGAEGYIGTSDDIGTIARCLGGFFSYVNLGKGNDSANRFLASNTNRRAIAEFSNWIGCGYGVNDILQQGRTAAQTYADMMLIRALFPNKKFFFTTVNISNNSSDSWATLVNQSAVAATSVIDTLNGLIRTGNTPYYELADFCQGGRNTQKWIVTGAANYATDDGVHETTVLNELMRTNALIPPATITM